MTTTGGRCRGGPATRRASALATPLTTRLATRRAYPLTTRLTATLVGVALSAGLAGCSEHPVGELERPAAASRVATTATSSSSTPSVDPEVARVEALQTLLDARAKAVLGRDRARFAATLDDPASGFGLRQLEAFDNLVRLPLGTFGYGTPTAAAALSAERAAEVGPDAWVARVEGHYTLKGWDRLPRTYETHLTAVRRAGGWRLADDSDGGTQTQLWDLPDLRVASSRSTLVVASGQVRDLTGYLRLGDRAVSRVGQVWTRPWGSRLVLVVPATAEEMAEQLGQSAASVEQVAAVTDGSLGTDGRAGSDRIVLNPQAFARLQPNGRQVVVTHETTHVAVRASTNRPVPLWLSEGLADYVGYSAVDLPRTTIADALLERVRLGSGPRALPTERDFDPSTSTIAPSYNAAWLAACRIVDQHGEKAFVRFYLSAASRPGASAPPGDPEQNTRRAFVSVLGTSEQAFTRAWLSYLRRLASA